MKLCVDCKYSVKLYSSEYKCRNKKSIKSTSPVNGSHVLSSCEEMRKYEKCGSEAILFQPIVVVPKSKFFQIITKIFAI